MAMIGSGISSKALIRDSFDIIPIATPTAINRRALVLSTALITVRIAFHSATAFKDNQGCKRLY